MVRLTMRREKTTSSDEAVATAHRHLSLQALRAYVTNLYGSDNTLTEGQVTKKNRAWLGQRLQMFHKVHSLHDVEALNRVFRGESSVSVGYLSHGVPVLRVASRGLRLRRVAPSLVELLAGKRV